MNYPKATILASPRFENCRIWIAPVIVRVKGARRSVVDGYSMISTFKEFESSIQKMFEQSKICKSFVISKIKDRNVFFQKDNLEITLKNHFKGLMVFKKSNGRDANFIFLNKKHWRVSHPLQSFLNFALHVMTLELVRILCHSMKVFQKMWNAYMRRLKGR